MKKLSVILAILFLAFAVQAQTVEKSKRNTKKETESAKVNKTNSKASKTQKVKAANTSRSSSKSNTTSVKAATGRKPNNSSGTSASRSGATKTNRTTTTVTRQTNSSSQGKTQVNRRGENNSGSSRTVTTPTSSKQGRGSNTGNVQRNQSSRVNQGYTPRTSPKDAEARRVYTVRHENRVIRKVPTIHYNYQPIEYRRIHNPYNRPILSDIYWDARMYRNYRLWYPDFNLWYYPYGYRIQMVSAYDSYNYIGEVARIYGVVSEVWYSPENRSYYLYVGGPYPYQDFTIVLEEKDARRYSRDPLGFFTNRQLTVTGLVSVFDDKPEMLIRRRSQINLY